jgi:hypothetical protein
MIPPAIGLNEKVPIAETSPARPPRITITTTSQ